MAGSSGGAGGAAGSAAPPCCLDSTIIEFRLIENDPERKKIGFDWLRTPQDQEVGITKEENAYVAADYGGTATGTVLGGFKQWTEEEIKAISEENPSGGHEDLTQAVAQGNMKGEYSVLDIAREDNYFSYRLKDKKYYVPLLNLMPPADYLLTEEQLLLINKVWKGSTDTITDPGKLALIQPILNTKRIDVASVEGVAYDKLSGEDQTKLLEAIDRVNMTEGIVNSVKLRLIKDFKEEPPKRITIDYEHEFLEITIKNGITRRDEGTGRTEVMVPVDYYGGLTEKLEEMRGLVVNIKTLKNFPGNLEVFVWAYSKSGVPERRLAGKLLVMANSKVKDTRIAIVKVKTKVDKKQTKTGDYSKNEKQLLLNVLHQALIIPALDEGKELDLSEDEEFQKGGAFVEDDLTINYNADNFGKHIEKAFLKKYPKFKDWFLVFVFADGSGEAGGCVDSYNYHDASGRTICVFRQTCFMFANRWDYCLGHELLHAYTLRHTQADEHPQFSSKIKYYFPNGDLLGGNAKEATVNIMNYNSDPNAWTTWAWQWEIMRAHVATVKRNPDYGRTGDQIDYPPDPGTY